MWKFVTRGIRETLERRVCRTNVYSQSSQDGNSNGEVKSSSLLCNHKFLAPKFSSFVNRLFGYTRTTGAKDEGDQSKWHAKYNWTDTVAWVNIRFATRTSTTNNIAYNNMYYF